MLILAPVDTPLEGVAHEEQNTKAFLGQRELGNGILFVTEETIAWKSETANGFLLSYHSVTMHAICRDPTAFPQPCLYLMINQDLDSGENPQDSDSEEDASEKFSEIRFVPSNPDNLNAMFQAMSECQALHPDEEDDEAADEFYFANGEEEPEHNGGPITTFDAPHGIRRPPRDAAEDEDAMDHDQFEDADS